MLFWDICWCDDVVWGWIGRTTATPLRSGAQGLTPKRLRPASISARPKKVTNVWNYPKRVCSLVISILRQLSWESRAVIMSQDCQRNCWTSSNVLGVADWCWENSSRHIHHDHDPCLRPQRWGTQRVPSRGATQPCNSQLVSLDTDAKAPKKRKGRVQGEKILEILGNLQEILESMQCATIDLIDTSSPEEFNGIRQIHWKWGGVVLDLYNLLRLGNGHFLKPLISVSATDLQPVFSGEWKPKCF